jgi:fluoride exporter
MAYIAVAIGGFLGACLRYGLSEWLGTMNGFPGSTLIINVFGSFFLAWFYTITSEHMTVNPNLRLGIGTGLVGAFTTFSTFTVDTWKLLSLGLFSSAFWYVILSLVLGLAAAYIGYFLAEWPFRIRVVRRRKEV